MSKVTEVNKKRKGASEPVVSAKKVKTTPEKPKALKSAIKKAPAAKAPKEAPTTSPAAAAKTSARPARKRAEDFLENKEEKPAKAAPATRASVKAKKVVESAPEEPAVKESAAAKVSKSKGKKTADKPVAQVEEITTVAATEQEDEKEDEDEDDEEVDDQTAALLAGFESSEDEQDPEDDAEGIPLDKVPSLPDAKNVRKQLKSAEKSSAENKPGVLYIGRIPHGFFEHQMRAYFTQFGDITHLRLSRNKVTGRSKHYAFMEFASAAVADIVAKTMDKYLLFGHILQVRRIPDDQVHAQLWKGEGRRFKVMPRNKIEGGVLSKGKTREAWEKKVQKETKKREKQAAKLQELGYDFEMPELRNVVDVPTQDALEGAGISDAGEVKAILEKKPEETKVEIVQTEQVNPSQIKVTSVVTEKAGTKRTKAKGDGKKAKKAKVAA